MNLSCFFILCINISVKKLIYPSEFNSAIYSSVFVVLFGVGEIVEEL